MLENDDDSVTGSGMPFPGKIAVITSPPTYTQNDEESWSAEQLMAKYGDNKIIHVHWPSFYLHDYDQVVATVASLAVDDEIRAIMINQVVPGCNTAVDKFREIRDDVFVVYSAVHESSSSVAERANLILEADMLGRGPAMVKQAKKQGAKVFVHYSFPRHMAIEHEVNCRDSIREKCAAEGLEFVDATVLDPTEDMYNSQEFISGNVAKLVAEYGDDTAFFCTNCFLQGPLIKAVIDNHAIFPQPCCPSPYHGFPMALGIDVDDDMPDLNYMINETKRIAAGKNMTGRLSTWPVSVSMMSIHAGVEYAIKWINRQVQETGVEDQVLLDCMSAYIKKVSGKEMGVSFTSCSEGDKVYNNYKLLLMDYLNY